MEEVSCFFRAAALFFALSKNPQFVNKIGQNCKIYAFFVDKIFFMIYNYML